jgi:hypothetical protein
LHPFWANLTGPFSLATQPSRKDGAGQVHQLRRELVEQLLPRDEHLHEHLQSGGGGCRFDPSDVLPRAGAGLHVCDAHRHSWCVSEALRGGYKAEDRTGRRICTLDGRYDTDSSSDEEGTMFKYMLNLHACNTKKQFFPRSENNVHAIRSGAVTPLPGSGSIARRPCSSGPLGRGGALQLVHQRLHAQHLVRGEQHHPPRPAARLWRHVRQAAAQDQLVVHPDLAAGESVITAVSAQSSPLNVLKDTYDHSCYWARSVDGYQHLMTDSPTAIPTPRPPLWSPAARGCPRSQGACLGAQEYF